MEEALCADPRVDPDIFFRAGNVQRAKNICRECPVKIECFAYAYSQVDEQGELHGIWGGTSLRGRKILKEVEAHGR
jgi:hypothetical protein